MSFIRSSEKSRPTLTSFPRKRHTVRNVTVTENELRVGSILSVLHVLTDFILLAVLSGMFISQIRKPGYRVTYQSYRAESRGGKI